MACRTDESPHTLTVQHDMYSTRLVALIRHWTRARTLWHGVCSGACMAQAVLHHYDRWWHKLSQHDISTCVTLPVSVWRCWRRQVGCGLERDLQGHRTHRPTFTKRSVEQRQCTKSGDSFCKSSGRQKLHEPWVFGPLWPRSQRKEVWNGPQNLRLYLFQQLNKLQELTVLIKYVFYPSTGAKSNNNNKVKGEEEEKKTNVTVMAAHRHDKTVTMTTYYKIGTTVQQPAKTQVTTITSIADHKGRTTTKPEPTTDIERNLMRRRGQPNIRELHVPSKQQQNLCMQLR